MASTPAWESSIPNTSSIARPNPLADSIKISGAGLLFSTLAGSAIKSTLSSRPKISRILLAFLETDASPIFKLYRTTYSSLVY